jgi:hypothetical protein
MAGWDDGRARRRWHAAGNRLPGRSRAVHAPRRACMAGDPWLRLDTDAGVTLPLAGQPGHGGTAYLRRQPARIVDGRMEGGYTGTFELICGQCGDHHYLDYSKTPRDCGRSAGHTRWRQAWQHMKTTSGLALAADGHRTGSASLARPGQELTSPEGWRLACQPRALTTLRGEQT